MNTLSYVLLTIIFVMNCLQDVEIVSKERIKNSSIIVFEDGTMFRKVEKTNE